MNSTESAKSSHGMDDAGRRLAVYGTLAPGRSNHHQLETLSGVWTKGTVRGHFHEEGWGATFGYPAIVLDANGPTVDIQLFESPDLPSHWDRLDEFEGSGYERAAVAVNTAGGEVPAFIYTLAPHLHENRN